VPLCALLVFLVGCSIFSRKIGNLNFELRAAVDRKTFDAENREALQLSATFRKTLQLSATFRKTLQLSATFRKTLLLNFS
jgi:hypothetical protein